MSYQVPDHVPLMFGTFGFRPPAHLAWSCDYERARSWLSLGVDATLHMRLPLRFHPLVSTRSWEETIPGERWPVLVKEYDTPGGTLRQEVYKTEDWLSPDWPDHGAGQNEIGIVDDFNVVRSRRFLVETEEDLSKLAYLLCPLPDEAIAGIKERAQVVSAQARGLRLAVECSVASGADMATWLCGVEGMVFMALDRPAMFEELMRIIHAHDRRNMEIALDLPVDVVTRRGYYEGAIYWSPALYRRFFLGPCKELTTMAHQAGRLMGYYMSAGFMPLLEAFGDIGFDVHFGYDPVQGGPGSEDLQRVKRTLQGKVAVHGGMNASVTLDFGTPDEIRRAVYDAVRVLGPGGGLILSPTLSLDSSTPWESVQTVIEAWNDVRDYPMREER